MYWKQPGVQPCHAETFPLRSAQGFGSRAQGDKRGKSYIVGARLAPNTFQIRRVTSQTKPMQECHPEHIHGTQGKLREGSARCPARDPSLRSG